jgi:hypothetical protein
LQHALPANDGKLLDDTFVCRKRHLASLRTLANSPPC